MQRKIIVALFSTFLLVATASAQRPEVAISLNEPFFDSLLDAVFTNFEPPEFSVASTGPGDGGSVFLAASFSPPQCAETVKILREMRGVRTAVRFREGKVVVPLAFTGTYSAPFVGCVEFAGWAESNLDLEFDQNAQKLNGRVRVTNVNLNGTGGIGGSVIARLIQSSIDKKMNPIEIFSLEKVSFSVPVQRSGTLKMRARNIKPEVGNGVLNVRVEYDFIKG